MHLTYTSLSAAFKQMKIGHIKIATLPLLTTVIAVATVFAI